MTENAESNDTNPMDRIRIQNEEYFEVYDYIAKNVPKEDQIEILNVNKQTVPDAEAQVNGLLCLLN